MSRDNAPFLHGKAGGNNPTRRHHLEFHRLHQRDRELGGPSPYEMVWEDPSPDAATWVRSEFRLALEKGASLSPRP